MFVYTLSSRKKQLLLCIKVIHSHYHVCNGSVIVRVSCINYSEWLLQLFYGRHTLLVPHMKFNVNRQNHSCCGNSCIMSPEALKGG